MAPTHEAEHAGRTTTPSPNPSPLALHERGAVTLVRAITGPTERSMPPEMTTTVWAAAAKAIGSTRWRATGGPARRSPAGRVREDEERQRSSRYSADGPAVAAHDRAASVAPLAPVDGGARSARAGAHAASLAVRDRGSAAASSGMGVRRQAVGRPQERRLIGDRGGHLLHHASAEDDDRAVAGQLDLLQLRGVQQDRRAGRRELAQQR